MVQGTSKQVVKLAERERMRKGRTVPLENRCAPHACCCPAVHDLCRLPDQHACCNEQITWKKWRAYTIHSTLHTSQLLWASQGWKDERCRVWDDPG